MPPLLDVCNHHYLVGCEAVHKRKNLPPRSLYVPYILSKGTDVTNTQLPLCILEVMLPFIETLPQTNSMVESQLLGVPTKMSHRHPKDSCYHLSPKAVVLNQELLIPLDKKSLIKLLNELNSQTSSP